MEGVSPLRPVATGMRRKEDMPFLYLVDKYEDCRYQIVIDEAMIDWGIYYIVRVKCQT